MKTIKEFIGTIICVWMALIQIPVFLANQSMLSVVAFIICSVCAGFCFHTTLEIRRLKSRW